MAFVVCEPCHDCKYTDCVTVCPCDCFYQDNSMLYIDPEHCIDCEARLHPSARRRRYSQDWERPHDLDAVHSIES